MRNARPAKNPHVNNKMTNVSCMPVNLCGKLIIHAVSNVLRHIQYIFCNINNIITIGDNKFVTYYKYFTDKYALEN